MRISRALLAFPILAGLLSAETKLVLNKSTVAPSLDLIKVTVPAGERVVLSIPVLSGNVWFKDGTPLLNGNGRVLVIESAKVEDSGRYRVGYVGEDSSASQEVSLTVVTSSPSNTSRFQTFATRGLAGWGDESLVTGFVVSEVPGQPEATKRVLIRAVGPTLESFGATGVLKNPLLAVYDSKGNTCVASTTDVAEMKKAELASGAYPIQPENGDAWRIVTLPAGSYTAQVSSPSEAIGVVMLEVYEIP
jgi:hypothetical protein